MSERIDRISDVLVVGRLKTQNLKTVPLKKLSGAKQRSEEDFQCLSH